MGCGSSLVRLSSGEFVGSSVSLRLAPEDLAGEWRCDENGVELALAPRLDARLHFSRTGSRIGLLEARGTEFVGEETLWNCASSCQVKLVPRGLELEYRMWLDATGNWSAPWLLHRLSHAEVAARGRYVALASLWEALAEGHTVLLKGTWLRELSNRAAVLPRRQELPPHAAWEPTELRHALEAGTVRIVALSYCWKQPDHPDPEGEQLQMVGCLIERRLAFMYPDGTRVLEDLAVFWDYSSLFQKPRSCAEQEAFDHGLSTVNLWYAHSSAEAWLLTCAPPGAKPYSERGWPVFERAVCGLITPQDSFLDIGLWEGGNEDWSGIARRCKAQREPPMRPERAAELLSTRSFTSGADFERVRHIYERTYYEVLGSVRSLNFSNLPRWGDHEAELLADCLPDCPQLEELRLSFDCIGAAGAAALGAAAAKCAQLRVVQLTENPLGDTGAAALIAGLVGCPTLEQLFLRKTGIGDSGAAEIAAALPHCHALRMLLVDACHISDVGAAALGAVLAQCTALETLEIDENQLSTLGKADLEAAWVSAGKQSQQCVV